MWRGLFAVSAVVVIFGACATPNDRPDGRSDSVERTSSIPPSNRVPPMYPRAAAEARIEGRVVVDLTVARNGHVVEAVVVESEPPGVFDQAVLDAVLQWRYYARAEGEPNYPDPVQVAIPFRIAR